MLSRFVLLMVLSMSRVVFALDLELTQGINAAVPIVVYPFGAQEQALQLAEVIKHDLHFSGQFKLIAGKGEVDTAWAKRAGAESVLTGRVVQIGNDRYDVSFQLLDSAANGRLLLAKQYQSSGRELRALAHHISDEVYHKLTGERGIFSTRIAYILVQRKGATARYSLEIADVDGSNPQSLLVSSEPIMSPSWSPDGRQIAYVSFERKRAQVYSVSVETGKRRLLTDFPGINGAPAWSPDGRELAVVLSKDGSPKLYRVNLSTGTMKQLTFGQSIDTEPRYTPDGRALIFTSNRGGSPQIYQLLLADGKISRVTFTGNYNARASYTPNQKNLVMLHRGEQSFHIGVQDAQTGRVVPVTFSSSDESPSVAPNGRLILYATRQNNRGILAMVSIDGRIRMQLPAREGDVQEPAWSPFYS